MIQCHFISEIWDCGRPSKERCECIGFKTTCDCRGHTHHLAPNGLIRLMNGDWEYLDQWEGRMREAGLGAEITATSQMNGR